ncbi:Ribosomal RNA large subunit methyltransferase I [Auxenochlorella protothecoides]|uniref:Ribosomal RNA large subunit methyltransferase I n=1 Tax=Auxenochlorella protothecoides TaxID=3075 RepID=A0A087STL4_AUXPR|nr:Ribosomal RNA large subunit methyltransferase I [Auxenochlorella protothecoides]KFM29068.1 Ribosomal RNA large subunit methyltransferase I [Auxenochlorella protothecoides]
MQHATALLRSAPCISLRAFTSAKRPGSRAGLHVRAAVASKTATPRLVLKGGKVHLFSRHRNPVVYGGAVDNIKGPAPALGDAVLVCDGAGAAFAWGFYNPHSMYRVRIMQMLSSPEQKAPSDIQALLRAKIQAAWELRRALDLPSQDTDVYRLVNSEGDGLSGLIIDVLGSQVVVAPSAAWCMRYRAEITRALTEVLQQQGTAGGAEPDIVWQPAVTMLTREEGWTFDDPGAAGVQGVAMNGPRSRAASGEDSGEEEEGDAGEDAETDSAASPASPADPPLIIREHGLRYSLDAEGPNQKTGFYADQRDSRLVLRQLSKGKRVLDLCCYTGGFALNAAAGGATHVLGLDSSHRAVHAAAANAALNGLDQVLTFERQDMKAWGRGSQPPPGGWDMVVLDPPKLAPGKKAMVRATRQYTAYNAAAMRLVAPGGLLMTCSCSGAMTQSDGFLPMLQDAARLAGRSLTLLRSAGAAPDHPLDPGYPEGRYLTNVLVRVT